MTDSVVIADATALRPTPRRVSVIHGVPRRRQQRGVVLLVLMIFMVLALSAVLLDRARQGAFLTLGDDRTQQALSAAREALLAFAVSHKAEISATPGVLPFPDRDADGAYDGNSDCVTGSVSYGHLLGRFPWRTGEQLCEEWPMEVDVRDGAGERLWYALSLNLVSYPDTFMSASPLNSDLVDLDPPSYPWLVVRDATGNVISDRVAAVIIAPGAALEGQDRSPATPTADQFLDQLTVGAQVFSNSDYNACQDPAPSCNPLTGEDFFQVESSAEFNDRLVYITIDELMARTRERVIGEVARSLRAYRVDYGRYPWLAPFMNPKLTDARIWGIAKSGSSGLVLKDTKRRFDRAEVQPGDLVWNVSDGSIGEVSAVGSDAVQVLSLAGGAENDFDVGELYVVHIGQWITDPTHLGGTAAAGSAGPILAHTKPYNMSVMGFRAGMVIENQAANDRSFIARFPAGNLLETTDSLNFSAGDAYRVRGRFGSATVAGATDQELVDASADFVGDGVLAGAVVHNITDDSVGLVVGTPSGTTLQVADLLGGVGASPTSFDSGEDYSINAFAGVSGVREGLLPFHAPLKPFRSGWWITWSMPAGDHNPVVAIPGADVNPEYRSNLEDFIESTAVSGALLVPPDEGICIWTVRNWVKCRSRVVGRLLEGTAKTGTAGSTVFDDTKDFGDWYVEPGDRVYKEGPDEAGGIASAGSNNLTLVDAAATFVSSNVEVNDWVWNETDGSVGVVSSVVSENSLTLHALAGGTLNVFNDGDAYNVRRTRIISGVAGDTLTVVNPDGGFAAGDDYVIGIAAREAVGTADTFSSNTKLFGALSQFDDIEPGDVVVNTSNGDVGLVKAKVSGQELDIVMLSGGALSDGDGFEVRYDFVENRAGEMVLGFEGVATVPSAPTTPLPGEQRQKTRDVSANSPFQLNSILGPTTIRLIDSDHRGAALGNANVTAQSGKTFSMDVVGIRMDLEPVVDLPPWFFLHEWQNLIYVAWANDEGPGGGGDCVTTGPCLRLDINGQVFRNDARAVVIGAGPQTATADRANGSACGGGPPFLCDYLEGENQTIDDDRFDRDPEGPAFNDRAIIVSP